MLPDTRAVVTNARYAGLIKRYHAWPTIKTQSVAEHTWQVMRIYHELFGPIPTQAVSYLLFDDAGEIVTGDVPHYVKIDNPDLKQILDRLEDAWLSEMGIEQTDDPVIRTKAKVCDLIEMWEFAIDELQYGNQFAKPIITNIRDALNKLLDRTDHLKMLDYDMVYAHMNKLEERS